MEENKSQSSTIDVETSLREENAQLKEIVRQLNDARGIKRLEFLFKVVENAVIFPQNVVDSTVKEIKEALFSEEPVDNKEE